MMDFVDMMKQRGKDISDALERKRQDFNKYRSREHLGTFEGLEKTIANRKLQSAMEDQNAK